jgi:hypothetical protein
MCVACRGLAKYNVGPFDPFFAKEVAQKRGGPSVNYRLKLKDVYERGWTKSHVTKFRYSGCFVAEMFRCDLPIH